MDNLGCSVRLVRRASFGEIVERLRNVTEIHYAYAGQPRVAFESDIHDTGLTCEIDSIIQFETTLETEKAECF